MNKRASGHNPFAVLGLWTLCILASVRGGESSSPPDRGACLASFRGHAFGTDSDVISCVGEASATCCAAVDEYMGLASPFANCTCVGEVLLQAIEDSIPKFAVELIEQRIFECGNVPLPNSQVCNDTVPAPGAVVFAVGGGACDDTPPPYSDFSCAQQAGWGKCDEPFMQGHCNLSCLRCLDDAAGDSSGNAGHSGNATEGAASRLNTRAQFEAGRAAAASGDT